jgi:hypothetical protein
MVDETRITDQKVESPALEADDGTINGKDAIGVGQSTGGDTSLGDWENTGSRPTILSMVGSISTDGTDNGRIAVQVDEDGGTTPDYQLTLVEANSTLGSGTFQQDSRQVILPSGSSYRVHADNDPENSANFTLERLFEL